MSDADNNCFDLEDTSLRNSSENNVLTFEVKDNMKKIGIKSLSLKEIDFEFTFNNSRSCCVSFSSKKASVSACIKSIEKKLYQDASVVTGDPKTFGSAIAEIEDQLIKRRVEIFRLSAGNADTTMNCRNSLDKENNQFKSSFNSDVANLRKKFKESGITLEQWQSMVAEKYENLRKVTVKNFPEAWLLLEFCLAVKSVLNIEGNSLPFMGVLLAMPSSMKTVVIQLFRKYPSSFYSDSFTPNSLVSHNSALSEEQLREIDMLPKINNNIFLTPELAPIFTAKEDDLQKILGIITRILDGHGFESDSGAQGHRRYGDIMFVWIGAGVEIPYRMWKVLGTLGHKIYFLRPPLKKKTTRELKRIAKCNDFSAKNKELEDALLDYLKTFDAALKIENRSKVDQNGIVKITWNEKVEGEQDKAIEYIAEVANMLAPLRGSVYLSESKSFRFNNSSESPANQHQAVSPHPDANNANFINSDGQDYDSDFPIIEDPSRAVILLRNLAIAHAISQGRDSLTTGDIPIAIKVALSTAPVRRVKVLDLLLREGGELKTSDIITNLRVSQPVARRTMREFHALGIADISAVAEYGNSEFKIALRSEFNWFKSKEFEKLKEDFTPSEGKRNGEVGTNEQSPTIEEDNTCDQTDGHTLKANSPPDTEQNIGTELFEPPELNGKSNTSSNDNNTDLSTNSSSSTSQKEINNSKSVKKDKNTRNNFKVSSKSLDTHKVANSKTVDSSNGKHEQNNAYLRGSDNFQHVTESHSHNKSSSTILTDLRLNPEELAVLNKILDVIKLANGSQISLNAAIESAHKKSENVRNLLGDKITQRDNKIVRKICFAIIRHPNIVPNPKTKPQLIVKWSDQDTNKERV